MTEDPGKCRQSATIVGGWVTAKCSCGQSRSAGGSRPGYTSFLGLSTPGRVSPQVRITCTINTDPLVGGGCRGEGSMQYSCANTDPAGRQQTELSCPIAAIQTQLGGANYPGGKTPVDRQHAAPIPLRRKFRVRAAARQSCQQTLPSGGRTTLWSRTTGAAKKFKEFQRSENKYRQ